MKKEVFKMIDKRKKYIMVIDIETTNGLTDMLAYDIGFIVADLHNNIYEKRSYMVAELFCDERYKYLLDTAYYKNKLPSYWEEYKEGNRQIKTILSIKREIKELFAQYGIKEVYAYNCYFDKVGSNKTLRYFTKSNSRWLFPRETEFYCIWHIACQTIFKQKTFEKLALLNNWISDSGNVKTSAEIAEKYITHNYDFEEEHKGLDDVLIEYEILLKCLRQHKSIDKSINRLCWRIPQKAIYKEHIAH